MRLKKSAAQGGLMIMLAAANVVAAGERIQTDWLEPKIGSRESKLDALVSDVDKNEATTVIEVQLRHQELKNYEEVIVIGKKTKKPLEYASRVEWLRDKNQDAYGVRIYFEGAPVAFLLRLDDGQ